MPPTSSPSPVHGQTLCSSIFGKCLARVTQSSLGQPSWASALTFFLGHPLPCCGEWGCGANLSRCANFPPLLAGISGHQAGTARAELNSKRLPKLTSGSWPPASVGREVTAEGAAEGGLLFSLCFGERLSPFCVFPMLKWIIQVCYKSVMLQGLVGCCKIRNKESAGVIGGCWEQLCRC